MKALCLLVNENKKLQLDRFAAPRGNQIAIFKQFFSSSSSSFARITSEFIHIVQMYVELWRMRQHSITNVFCIIHEWNMRHII